MQSPKSFIEAARAQGATDEFIVKVLKSSGWSEKQVMDEFTKLYESKTGITLPSPSVSRGESAKDAFLYLLSFSTLGTWVGAIGSMMFTIINSRFPDLVIDGGYSSYNVAWELASIIVAFPIYLFVMRVISHEIRENPEKLDSGVRKWLTYITLLITAGFVIGDLITFLDYFLRGELTARFILKVVTVFLLAGGVFWYYLSGVRQKNRAGQQEIK